MHLHTVYMAYAECLPTRLNPLAERACFSQVPGFIANRLLVPYLNEAVFALYEGIGSAEDIDTVMKLGTNSRGQ